MIRKCIITGIVLLWMVMIFWFSSQTAQDSSQMSGGVGTFILETVFPGFQDLSETEKVLYAQRIEFPIRKAAHASEYALLCIWIALWFKTFGVLKKRKLVVAVLLTTCYAITDEIHQLFVPGRSGEVRDVCIDALGAMVGAIAVSMIWKKLQKLQEKKKNQGIDE